MKNPIPSSSLFTTPDSAEQLQHMADSMSNSAEAWRMMVFTFNYCHQLVEEMLNPAVVDITQEEIDRTIKELCLEMDVTALKSKLERLEQLMRL